MPLRPTPSRSNPPAAAVPAVPVAPSAADLDHHLKNFWEKYNRAVYAVCCVILAAILAKGGWDYFAGQREAAIEAEFAAATGLPAQKAFVSAHPDHPLAGVAELQIADAAYAANQVGEALAGYAQAADILKTGPLAARARLGLAMAKIQSGRQDEGAADLRALVGDAQGYKTIRSEAAYHLASLAAAAGRSSELQGLSTQLMQMDPDGQWTQRVFALQAQAMANAGDKPAIAPALPRP